MRHEENYEKRAAQRWAHYEQEDVNGKLVITQRELTERLGIQPGSASEVIAKLENAVFLIRTESESDRRTVDVILTKEGSRQAEEAKAQREGRHGEMFSALSQEEKAQLLGLLEKVNADWESRYADRQHHPHGPHGKHGHHGSHSEWEGGNHHEGSGPEGRPHCSHDCQNCPNPCGRGWALRESR